MQNLTNQPLILLVDDNKENLDLLIRILSKLNAKFIRASSSSDALRKTSGEELALAIVGVNNSEISGYDTAAKLNEISVEKKVPVLFLTDKDFELDDELDYEINEYSFGAIDYIIKPFSQTILLSKVNIFLDLFEQKRTILHNAQLLSQLTEELSIANNQLKQYELKQLKEQLFKKTLLDNIPSIYYVYTYPQLKLIEWNKKHEAFFGYKNDEVEGRSILDWHLNKNEASVLESLNNLSEQSQTSFETVLFNKDGRSITFLITAVKLVSKGQQYILGIATDISEHKKVEEALRESESVLTRAQQIAHVGSWEYDYQSEKMKCSDETLRIFGYKPEDVVPTLELFYSMVHPLDSSLLKESIASVLNLKIPLSIEFRIQLCNGEERVIHEQAEVTYNEFGEAIKWLGTVQDMTQRKKTEDELNDSLEQLHLLSKHIEQARESERLNLARELHDDLGQALTAVKIDLEIIMQHTLDKAAKEKLSDVKVLVGDTIRTVQRITSQLRPEIIDDLGLESAIEWYSKEFSQRYGIDIFLDIEHDIPITNEEALPLFRIMQESLTNIARHAKATHIEILLFRKKDFVQFEITDNGVGIIKSKINSKKSFGIMSMRERTASLGGTFKIFKRSKFGSKILILFPISKNKL